MASGGSSSSNPSNNPNPNPNPNPSRKNNGKAPASSSSSPTPQHPPTGSSNPNPNPSDGVKSSGLPPIPPPAQGYREQDRYMPIANVVRIMRKALPKNAKISDEAKETVQECVSEFIAFVTEEANEKCRQEHRKSITGDDLLFAMKTLGFDNYVDPLSTYLNKYRQKEAVGLGSTEMATRQRRHANRAASLQIQGSSSYQAGGAMANPTMMPPPAMINRQHAQTQMLNPVNLQLGHFTASGHNAGAEMGSNPNPDPNHNSSSSTSPSMNFNLGGATNGGELDGFEMPSIPSTPSASDADMSFLDLLNFK